MFKEITEHWNQFRHYPVGERFQCYYRSRHESQRSTIKKVLLIGSGILSLAVGVIFLVIPGPGLLLLLTGAALIARESLFVSRLFDRLEPHLWKLARWCKKTWRHLPRGAKILLIAIAAISGLLALYITYNIFFD